MSGEIALAGVDPKTVLARYEAGEPIADIAAEHNTSDVTLYHFLIEREPELWKSLTAATALSELDKAAKLQDEAPDMLSLSRARERVGLCKWRLERLLRKHFGQDQPLSGSGQVQINIGISSRQHESVTVDTQVIEKKDKSTDT